MIIRDIKYRHSYEKWYDDHYDRHIHQPITCWGYHILAPDDDAAYWLVCGQHDLFMLEKDPKDILYWREDHLWIDDDHPLQHEYVDTTIVMSDMGVTYGDSFDHDKCVAHISKGTVVKYSGLRQLKLNLSNVVF